MHVRAVAPDAMNAKRLFAVAVVGLLVAASPAAAAGANTTSTADGSLSVSTEYENGTVVVHVEEHVDGNATLAVRPTGDAAYAGSGTYTVNGSETVTLAKPDSDRTLSLTATTDSGARVTQVVQVGVDDGILDSGVSLTVVSESAVTADATASGDADASSTSNDSDSAGDDTVGVEADANVSADVDAGASADANASADAGAEANASGDGGLFGIDVGLGAEASGDAKAGGAADDGGLFGVDVNVGGAVEDVRASVDGWLQSTFGLGVDASASGSASAGA